MLSRLGKGSTYKGKQGELEFLNYGAHDGGGGGDGGSPKVSTTLMGARTGEDWGWLIAATKMNLANPAQPTPLNSLILGLDNPVTELLDICRCVVTQPTNPARFGQN